ncbi:hypothetical protein GCM10011609_76650 [Lentzea pudingi]|uniref:Uncharacterized protein n=1 Tax=Lentzea pudingi TaxID=1789439 RepID=A0ABQ2INS4_9PSEU|nr:hypothetical protein GCM10011609_76650 [Lentzea pudingi]
MITAAIEAATATQILRLAAAAIADTMLATTKVMVGALLRTLRNVALGVTSTVPPLIVSSLLSLTT